MRVQAIFISVLALAVSATAGPYPQDPERLARTIQGTTHNCGFVPLTCSSDLVSTNAAFDIHDCFSEAGGTYIDYYSIAVAAKTRLLVSVTAEFPTAVLLLHPQTLEILAFTSGPAPFIGATVPYSGDWKIIVTTSERGRLGAYKIDTACVGVGTAPSCEPTSLCLIEGRFHVSVTATDQRTGNTGGGMPITNSDFFGYFTLPALTNSAQNPEIFVKILDGRGVNGKFWLFYSGLTDFEYTVTVTDSQSGQSKSYTKPAGSPAGGFDTELF